MGSARLAGQFTEGRSSWKAAGMAAFMVVCLWSACKAAEAEKAIMRGSPDGAVSTAEVGLGDLYALVVGVSRYSDSRIPQLKLSDKDARDFAKFLETQRQLFRKVHVTLLCNEKATKRDIETHLYYELRKAGKDDTVVVFLSGHGADDPNTPGEFFFLTHDSDPTRLAVSAVHMNRQWFLAKLDSKRVVVIADACHAGGFSGQGTKALRRSIQGFVDQFKDSEGKVVITSSRADEVARESPDLGNSLFTYHLLEGLRGQADTDRDGVVTLRELYDYVYSKTKDAANGFQHPQMEGRFVGKFPLSLSGNTVEAVARTKPETIKPQEPRSPQRSQESPDEVAVLQNQAGAGKATAQYELGVRYEHGLGVPKSRGTAILWYFNAAQQNHPEALEALARFGAPWSSGRPAPTGPPAGAPGGLSVTAGQSPSSGATSAGGAAGIGVGDFPMVDKYIDRGGP